MPVDSRSPEAAYCSKPNILLPRARYGATAQVTGVGALKDRAAEIQDLSQDGQLGLASTITRSTGVLTDTKIAPAVEQA